MDSRPKGPTITARDWHRAEGGDRPKGVPNQDWAAFMDKPPIERMWCYLDAIKPKSGEWQPIESAPKGGGAEMTTDPEWVEPPKILLRFGTEAISVAYWDWFYAEGGAGFTDGFAWIEPCSGDPLNLHYTTPPDGWMPAPTGEQR